MPFSLTDDDPPVQHAATGPTIWFSVPAALTQVVNQGSADVTLTSRLNSSSSGQSVTFTATVSPAYVWTNTLDVRAIVWNVDANGNRSNDEYFCGPFTSYTAQRVARGSDGASWLTWLKTDSTLSFIAHASGNIMLTVTIYGPLLLPSIEIPHYNVRKVRQGEVGPRPPSATPESLARSQAEHPQLLTHPLETHMTSPAGGAPVTPEKISQLSWGFAPTLMMDAAVHYGLFDLLDEGQRTAAELAETKGLSLRGASAVLNALASFGLLSKDASGRFGLTPESSAFLVSSRPGYMGGILKHTTAQLLPKWLQLKEVMRTGRPAMAVNQEAQGSAFFHEFVEDIFPMSYPAAQRLADVLEIARAEESVKVLDLAAGSGVWSISLAQKSPHVHVTAVDWPGVLDVTRRVTARFGVADRYTFVAGDLESAPFGTGHDIAVLGHILHSEGEAKSRKLLARTFAALAPGGTIAIQEFLVDDSRSSTPVGLLFAVNMLLNTDDGDTYSFNEIASWLQEAGFDNSHTVESPGPSPLILARRPKYTEATHPQHPKFHASRA